MKLILRFIVCFVLCSCSQSSNKKPISEKNLSASQPASLSVREGNEIIKREISMKSEDYRMKVAQLNTIVDEFVAYISNTQTDLLSIANEIEGNDESKVIRCKTATNQYFLQQKNGAKLKNKITTTQSEFVGLVDFKDRENLSALINLSIDSDMKYLKTSQAEDWEHYKFENMPIAAVLPILSKYVADAYASERLILEYWQLKQK